MDAFKEISALNFYGRSNVESNIQHAVEKDIGDANAPKRSRTRNVYYAEESDSDENDQFHDNDDDRDGCYIPEIDFSDEEPENEVEVAIEIDKEDDVEDALNDLGSGVEDLSVECDVVIDEATATPIDRRPRLREVQEGPLRGKKVPAHLFPPDIEPENRFYESELEKIKPVANEYHIPKGKLTKFIEGLSSAANISKIHRTIGNSSMLDENVRILTGLSWYNFSNLCQKTSMPDSESRNVMQALITFLFKMRTGNCNEVISGVLGFPGPQYVSNYCNLVVNSFEKDVLPTHFVFAVYTRVFLIQHHTAEITSRLHNLAVICDGTYIYHKKSTNNFYQRKSYSGQKKKPLCKPFTICFTGTDDFVINLPEPYYSTQNEVEIFRTVILDPNGLPKLLQPGDVYMLDKDFRDVKNFLESFEYGVLTPALKGNMKQLTAEESND
ncbi:hypothetical protein FQA39_LY14057 [Lamprigera yunnana]|nr:hypothetical protein FQA39_LY14057 [Lamprigera yunnana]